MFPGIGTVVNIATILLGSTLGVLLGHRINERTRALVTDALGLVTLLIAALTVMDVRSPALSGRRRALRRRCSSCSAPCWSAASVAPSSGSRTGSRRWAGGCARRLSGGTDAAEAQERDSHPSTPGSSLTWANDTASSRASWPPRCSSASAR